ncbi:unnamed protein product [Lymnaea stagnalis]|uniref:E3 ubiquitin-protein ligase RNF25 n=1 Tax=Lymnaea stagnalis TaxID=6523 RepID=A0AAV2HNW7_LYMST
MADSGENAIETELETLEAIYIHELTCTRKEDGTVDKISALLHPATGHDTRKQYVCMTLVFSPGPNYPDEAPEIQICNPRGLGEEEMVSLLEALTAKAEEIKGEVMLYTLIEMAKDSLTDGNIPRCPCCVCLEHFDEKDLFHRTACYHYFHAGCLHKYVQHTQAQLEEEKKEVSESRHLDGNSKKERGIACPMCRSPLVEEDLQVVMSGKVEDDYEKLDVFVVPPELREQQRKMAEVYQRQKAKGGIIDPEMEKNKFLVNQEERLPVPNPETSRPVESVVRPHHVLDAKGRKEGKIEGRRDDRGNNRGRSRGRHHNEFRGGSFGKKQRKVHSGQAHPREDLVNRVRNDLINKVREDLVNKVREDVTDKAQQDGIHSRSEERAGVRTVGLERLSDNIEGTSGVGLKAIREPGRSRDGVYQGGRGGHRGEHEVDGLGGGRREEYRGRDGRRDYGTEGTSEDERDRREDDRDRREHERDRREDDRDRREHERDRREWLASEGRQTEESSCNTPRGVAETTHEKTNLKGNLEDFNPHCDNGQSWRDRRPEHRNSYLHEQDDGFGPSKSAHDGRASSGRLQFRDNISKGREKDGTAESKPKDFVMDKRDGRALGDENSVKDTDVAQTEIQNVSIPSESKTLVHSRSVKGPDNVRSDKPKFARGEPVSRRTYGQRQATDGYKCDRDVRPGPHCDKRDDESKPDEDGKTSGAGGRDRKHHGASGRAGYPGGAHYRQEGYRHQQYTNHQHHEHWRHQDRRGYVRNRPDRGDDRRTLQNDATGTGRNVDKGQTQTAPSGENSIPADPQDDGKADLRVREINNRWRQLNFGRSFDDGNHGPNANVSLGTDDDDSNDVRLECNGATGQQSDDLDLYYIGYRDMITQAESWEDEIDPFATERLRFKASKRAEYDQMRTEDRKLYKARLEERVAMENSVLEEEKRMVKEETQRQESCEEKWKGKDPEKSVLELFKERQNKKQLPETSAQKSTGEGRVVGDLTLSVKDTEPRPTQGLHSAETPCQEKQSYINTDISQIEWFGKGKDQQQKAGKSLPVRDKYQQEQVGRYHDVRDSNEDQAGKSHDTRDSNQELRNGLQSVELTPADIKNSSTTATTNETYQGGDEKIKGGKANNGEIKAENSDGVSVGVEATNSKQKHFIKPPPLKFSKKLKNETSLDSKRCLETNPLPATTLLTTPLSTTPLPATTLSTTPLPATTLSTTPLPATTLSTTPLPATTLSTTPLPATTLSTTSLPATTLSTTPLPATTLSTTLLSNDPRSARAESVVTEAPQLIQAIEYARIKHFSQLDLALGQMMALNHVMALGHVTHAPSHSVPFAPSKPAQVKKLPKIAPLSFKKKTNRSNSGDATGQPFTQIADVTNKRRRAHQCLDKAQDHGDSPSSNHLMSHTARCFNGIHQNGSGLNMDTLSKNAAADTDSLKENLCSFQNS